MAHKASSCPGRNQQSTSERARSRMPSLFNTIRAILCRGCPIVHCHLFGDGRALSRSSSSLRPQFVLLDFLILSSEIFTVLARFVPFAIFVCVASILIFTVLLVFSFLLKERNPISTRIELLSLGLAAVFWLVLGIYLTTSESQDADVECFSSNDPQIVLDSEVASFRTEQYQAMYRVLNAFALMNAILIIFACLTLLFLALRRHRNGENHMWHGPVTSCGNLKKNNQAKMSSSSSILPVSANRVEAPVPPVKDKLGPEFPHRKQSSYSRKEYASEKRSRPNVLPPPSKKPPTRQDSGRSGTSKSSTVPRSLMSEIDNGLMLHPNDLKQPRQ